jgi:hypothetical protein
MTTPTNTTLPLGRRATIEADPDEPGAVIVRLTGQTLAYKMSASRAEKWALRWLREALADKPTQQALDER